MKLFLNEKSSHEFNHKTFQTLPRRPINILTSQFRTFLPNHLSNDIQQQYYDIYEQYLDSGIPTSPYQSDNIEIGYKLMTNLKQKLIKETIDSMEIVQQVCTKNNV
jgi:hypothetical protein